MVAARNEWKGTDLAEACGILAPEQRSRRGSIAWRSATLETSLPSAKGSQSCASVTGPGYRVYLVERGATLCILLCGGDKFTQQNDIERAKRLARELEE